MQTVDYLDPRLSYCSSRHDTLKNISLIQAQGICPLEVKQNEKNEYRLQKPPDVVTGVRSLPVLHVRSHMS